jgi:hypothetical protein
MANVQSQGCKQQAHGSIVCHAHWEHMHYGHHVSMQADRQWLRRKRWEAHRASLEAHVAFLLHIGMLHPKSYPPNEDDRGAIEGKMQCACMPSGPASCMSYIFGCQQCGFISGLDALLSVMCATQYMSRLSQQNRTAVFKARSH